MACFLFRSFLFLSLSSVIVVVVLRYFCVFLFFFAFGKSERRRKEERNVYLINYEVINLLACLIPFSVKDFWRVPFPSLPFTF